MKFGCRSIGVCVAAWLMAASVYGQATTGSPMLRNGPLRRAAAVMSQLLQGRIEDGRFRVSRIESPHETESFLDNTDGSVGSGGFSYSRDNEWQLSYGNESIWLRIRQRIVRPNAQWQDWIIDERMAPFRQVLLSVGPNGEIHLEMSSSRHGYLLHFFQARDGACVVQELSDEYVFSAASASLLHLCKEHPEFSGDRLMPALSSAGIAKIKTPYHRQVVQAVRMHFHPLTSDERESLQTVMQGLDSPVFAERQQASKQIAALWKREESLILRLLTAESLSPESKRRIRDAIGEAGLSGKDWLDALDLVEADELLNERDFLQWVLNVESDETIRMSLAEHLAHLPAEFHPAETTNLGSDNSFAANNNNLAEPTPVFPSRDAGGFSRLIKPIGRLVHVVERDGRMTLDRQHWADQFGGKTIQELVKETRDFIRDQQLPVEWFQPNQDNEMALDYPPVIFQSIKQDLNRDAVAESPWHQWGHETLSSGWTDTIYTGRFRLTLNWGSDSKPGVLGRMFASHSKPFRLAAEESAAPRRQLIVDSSIDGRLLLRLGSREERWVLQICQFADGSVVVHDVRGTASQFWREESFPAFRERVGDYLTEEILPVFQAAGITIH